jgi:hypothetical protein
MPPQINPTIDISELYQIIGYLTAENAALKKLLGQAMSTVEDVPDPKFTLSAVEGLEERRPKRQGGA